jgi:hypothetical protein
LIYYPNAEKVLLFDLNKDPLEMEDIAGIRENKKIMENLTKELHRLQIEVGDTLKLSF